MEQYQELSFIDFSELNIDKVPFKGVLPNLVSPEMMKILRLILEKNNKEPLITIFSLGNQYGLVKINLDNLVSIYQNAHEHFFFIQVFSNYAPDDKRKIVSLRQLFSIIVMESQSFVELRRTVKNIEIPEKIRRYLEKNDLTQIPLEVESEYIPN